jgi:hypothetical protein
MIMQKPIKKSECEVCGSKINVFRKAVISVYDYIITCEDHDSYGHLFQLWMIKKELGYPYKEPKRECDICGCELTDQEFDSTLPTDINITCTAHAGYKSAFDNARTKRELGISK